MTGTQYLGGAQSAELNDTFHGIDPRNGSEISTAFHEASPSEIDRAVSIAAGAFDSFRATSIETRAKLLDAIAEEILAQGTALTERASAETGHPMPRCEMERDRAANQSRVFAKLLREGSWCDARIDVADPGRTPIPKPDVRSVMRPIGPIAVYGASNFPIAISVLGSDTVSAFASGCPVVIKGHPAHPGTCEIAAGIAYAAIQKVGLSPEIFSLVQGRSHRVGLELVQHPLLAGAAFTGSLGGGRALFDAANNREVPIPFYAEMGSINPIFLLPGALKERAESIANGFVTSLTMGVGQFCTNPGMVVGLESEGLAKFNQTASAAVESWAPATMLHAGIHEAYESGISEREKSDSLELLAKSSSPADPAKSEAAAYLFTTSHKGLMEDDSTLAELFGPVSTVVKCDARAQLLELAERLEGSLSISVHGTEADLAEYGDLIAVLERKAGRLIFNGYPVGIEVNDSIHHGGPYPATAHAHFTSIGTRSISRFVRPVCYQDWPDAALPEALQNANPQGILRIVNGERTRDAVS
ncbi:MAG: aldehyde dehydrogenase (NADP(+)) [Verrucomicrobiota bacterium]